MKRDPFERMIDRAFGRDWTLTIAWLIAAAIMAPGYWITGDLVLLLPPMLACGFAWTS